MSERINQLTGLETRRTVLGYIQRGGSPSPMDRLLATRFGAKAVELVAKRDYGKMVALKGHHIEPVPLSEVGGKLRLVPPDHSLIKKARGMDVCFGRKI
jgi:6-phosphofructokinase 1